MCSVGNVRANQPVASDGFDEATADIERAIELAPASSTPYNNLAWALATGPEAIRDRQRAVALAEKAIALASPPQAYHFGTGGAAD